MADELELSPLVPPSPMVDPSEIDLEAGHGEQIQCRICLESDGNAPRFKINGSECLIVNGSDLRLFFTLI